MPPCQDTRCLRPQLWVCRLPQVSVLTTTAQAHLLTSSKQQPCAFGSIRSRCGPALLRCSSRAGFAPAHSRKLPHLRRPVGGSAYSWPTAPVQPPDSPVPCPSKPRAPAAAWHDRLQQLVADKRARMPVKAAWHGAEGRRWRGEIGRLDVHRPLAAASNPCCTCVARA